VTLPAEPALLRHNAGTGVPSPSPRPDASRLLARGLGVQTHPTPHNVSEMIYAAYHALRRAQMHGRRIAKALNRHNISTEARGETDRTWGSDEVVDRLKQYEDYWKRHHPGQDSRALRQWRNGLGDRSLVLFPFDSETANATTPDSGLNRPTAYFLVGIPLKPISHSARRPITSPEESDQASEAKRR
jgi:hypothetical protein